jgi:hypothetical protein
VRTLSRKAVTLSDAEKGTELRVTSRGMHVGLAGLAEEVIRARVDLVHFPLLFYLCGGQTGFATEAHNAETSPCGHVRKQPGC